MKSKSASQIEPGDSIVVKGNSVVVEYVGERQGLITIAHTSGRMHCALYDKILMALSRGDAIEEALQIMDKAELP